MQKNTNQKWLIIFFWWLKICLKVSLSLSLSLSIFQFKCALLAWQKLYICIAKAIAAGLLTSSAHLN